MTERCTRWMDLSDRQLVGGDLPKPDFDFVRAHELECAECGREAALLRELRPAPLRAVPNDDDVRRILLLAELNAHDELNAHEELNPLDERELRFRPRIAAVAMVAALLAVAASLMLLIRKPDHARSSANVIEPATAARARSTPKANALASRATEDSCGPLIPGIVLCLTAGSEVGEVELNGPRRMVELRRGRAVASLEPQPKGSSFSIVTRYGEVTALGTIFSVELARDGRAYARVVRGKVLARANEPKAEQVLLAGQQLRLGDSSSSALPLPEAERDLDLVARWPSSEDLSGSRSERRAAEPEGSDAQGVSGIDPGQPSIRDELGRARELRARGLFTRAAAIYRSIHARSPRSESGRAALMSLASLQLSALGDPKGALASYQGYLAGGNGALRQQAEYGKIRALRGLGRVAEELEATRKFIDVYPNAPEARLLKERLGGSSKSQ